MKRLFAAACAAVVVAAASTASAADLRTKPIYKAPVFVAPFSWTGFYIGLNGGYSWGKSDFSSTLGSGGVKPKGALAGGTVVITCRAACGSSASKATSTRIGPSAPTTPRARSAPAASAAKARAAGSVLRAAGSALPPIASCPSLPAARPSPMRS